MTSLRVAMRCEQLEGRELLAANSVVIPQGFDLETARVVMTAAPAEPYRLLARDIETDLTNHLRNYGVLSNAIAANQNALRGDPTNSNLTSAIAYQLHVRGDLTTLVKTRLDDGDEADHGGFRLVTLSGLSSIYVDSGNPPPAVVPPAPIETIRLTPSLKVTAVNERAYRVAYERVEPGSSVVVSRIGELSGITIPLSANAGSASFHLDPSRAVGFQVHLVGPRGRVALATMGAAGPTGLWGTQANQWVELPALAYSAPARDPAYRQADVPFPAIGFQTSELIAYAVNDLPNYVLTAVPSKDRLARLMGGEWMFGDTPAETEAKRASAISALAAQMPGFTLGQVEDRYNTIRRESYFAAEQATSAGWTLAGRTSFLIAQLLDATRRGVTTPMALDGYYHGSELNVPGVGLVLPEFTTLVNTVVARQTGVLARLADIAAADLRLYELLLAELNRPWTPERYEEYYRTHPAEALSIAANPTGVNDVNKFAVGNAIQAIAVSPQPDAAVVLFVQSGGLARLRNEIDMRNVTASLHTTDRPGYTPKVYSEAVWYTVKGSDGAAGLSGIAQRYGVSYLILWNDPHNDQLRTRAATRLTPYEIWAGDMIYIPQSPVRATLIRQIGQYRGLMQQMTTADFGEAGLANNLAALKTTSGVWDSLDAAQSIVSDVHNGIVRLVLKAKPGHTLAAGLAVVEFAFKVPATAFGNVALPFTLAEQASDSDAVARLKLLLKVYLELRPVAEFLANGNWTGLVHLPYTVASGTTRLIWGINFDELEATSAQQLLEVKGAKLAVMFSISAKIAAIERQLNALE